MIAVAAPAKITVAATASSWTPICAAFPARRPSPPAALASFDAKTPVRTATEVLAWARRPGGDQGRHAGADVHHRPAGRIEHAACLEPPAGAPDPVGERVVHDRRP